jgi:Zn finger protein HypA/HybF involved in hydrogenase expression
MDCITCHNRITHLVNQPEKSIDIALDRGTISLQIPDIRRLAVDALRGGYATKEIGFAAIAGIKNYYQTYEAQFLSANQESIDNAIMVIQDIYDQSVYPEQKSDWDSHFNNIGHRFSPGCFRCHDGKHLNEEQEAVRLECNLCHSIPVVAGREDFVTDIEISRGPEPETHLNANWIVLHRQAFDASCQNCHTTDQPGGTENTSFCSNSACHGNTWEYAGFDAPSLREILMDQMPEVIQATELPAEDSTQPLTYDGAVSALLNTRCSACHGAGGMQGLDITSYASLMKGSLNGAVIIPGDAEGSLLVQKQSGPQNHFGQFSPEELNKIKEWINAGALEK